MTMSRGYNEVFIIRCMPLFGTLKQMNYLRINKLLRALFFAVGFLGLSYGIYDISRSEAGRKGINSNHIDSPFSYYFTISKKVLLGTAFIGLALSPILGKAKEDE